jgi:predicted methyltransferase
LLSAGQRRDQTIKSIQESLMARFRISALAALALVPLAATASPPEAPTGATTDPVLAAVVAGDWRGEEAKARDRYRHPVEALTFWGLKPGMAILEVQPGSASWWTDILAPYAKRTGGTYYVTGADLDNPDLSPASRQAREEFAARYAAKPDLYGNIHIVNWGPKSKPLPADTFDFILTARSVHGWMRTPGMVDKVFREFYDSLKPGGILALEQHRASPGPQDPKAESGYVTEDYVLAAAEKAGFKLAAKSEINANAKDTKDHPFGVWTLPPSLRSTPYTSDKTDPAFDHSKYLAIGESDRMTLKFVKAK